MAASEVKLHSPILSVALARANCENATVQHLTVETNCYTQFVISALLLDQVHTILLVSAGEEDCCDNLGREEHRDQYQYTSRNHVVYDRSADFR